MLHCPRVCTVLRIKLGPNRCSGMISKFQGPAGPTLSGLSGHSWSSRKMRRLKVWKFCDRAIEVPWNSVITVPFQVQQLQNSTFIFFFSPRSLFLLSCCIFLLGLTLDLGILDQNKPIKKTSLENLIMIKCAGGAMRTNPEREDHFMKTPISPAICHRAGKEIMTCMYVHPPLVPLVFVDVRRSSHFCEIVVNF